MKFLLILTTVFIVFFSFFPNVDLWFSSFFYEEGKGFIYRDNPITVFFYDAIVVLIYTVIFGIVLTTIIKKIRPDYLAYITYRNLAFLFFALILVPGIIIHWGFKDNWGRARPVNIEQYGGNDKYTPFYEIKEKKENKSFMSGHVSAAFYFASFAYLATGRRRKLIYSSTLILGTITGLVRVMQGGHFLSDVVFTGLLTLIIIHLLYSAMYKKKTLSN